MKIEIIKTPNQLTKDELVSIFKKATGFNFQKYCIDEFEIDHNKNMFVPVTNISCKNTGYSAIIHKDYSIEVKSSVVQLSNKTNILGIADVLLSNGIIKVINNS